MRFKCDFGTLEIGMPKLQGWIDCGGLRTHAAAEPVPPLSPNKKALCSR